ncbi:cytosol aminopeptidase [Sergentomyia squamirostris]
MILKKYFTTTFKDFPWVDISELMSKEAKGLAGPLKVGQTCILWNCSPKYPAVAVAGLGDATSWDVLDALDDARENVRIAVGAGVKALAAEKITQVEVEDFNGHAEAAAEGALLAAYRFQEYKKPEARKTVATVTLAEGCSGLEKFKRGEIVTRAQNWSRLLMEIPANLMTPTIFAAEAQKKLTPMAVEVVAHDLEWARSLGMESFLSVAKGSDEPPVFLELTYNGAGLGQKPLCLVGKGITFDSGGISIKGANLMDEMRADMGGGIVLWWEQLQPWQNSKRRTSHSGRCSLCYAERFDPRYIVDMATLTGAIRVALGLCVTGAFSTNDELFNHLSAAGSKTGKKETSI